MTVVPPDPAALAATGPADVGRLVSLLRHDGPVPLGDLPRHEALGAWSADRVEQAVVQAWSTGWIYVNGSDDVVAL